MAPFQGLVGGLSPEGAISTIEGWSPSKLQKGIALSELTQTITFGMGQSLVRNYMHIVFSTKHRQPLIKPPFESELHNYVGGVCKEFDCQPLIVGGYVDHIHILCLLSKKITLMKLLEKVKSHSSKWIKTLVESIEHFYWQDGYGAFSVGPSGVDRAKRYIANQHNHHKKQSFKDEFLEMLVTHDMDYDERYMWD